MDLISRQSAIDAIHEDADWLAAQGSDWQTERMERDKSILKSLPSAQPEIIHCRDCKYYHSVTAQCEIRGKGLYLIRGNEDYCSRAERRTDD